MISAGLTSALARLQHIIDVLVLHSHPGALLNNFSFLNSSQAQGSHSQNVPLTSPRGLVGLDNHVSLVVSGTLPFGKGGGVKGPLLLYQRGSFLDPVI